MRRPTRQEIFDGLYAHASADGRGTVLFGDSHEGARTFFGKALLARGFPAVYLEFPLAEEPALDLLAIYDYVAPGAAFAAGAGYGYGDAFSWFSHASAPEAAIGLELDLSQGSTTQAGVYLQQRDDLSLVRPFLRSVGAQERTEAYERMARRMPRGWPAAYVGLFPGREGSPVRLGGYLSEPSRQRCSDDPAFLGTRFDLMGFSAYDQVMLERCSLLMGMVPAVDFQFDIMPNGTLSPTFGLSLSFSRCPQAAVAECFESGYGAAVMRTFDEWGLADGRWHLIAGAPFARRIDYEDTDGTQGSLIARVRLNYAKVKFVNATPRSAKFYLVLTAEGL